MKLKSLMGQWVNRSSAAPVYIQDPNLFITLTADVLAYECGIPSADHYNDVIMTVIACQITSLPSVYSTVYSDADQRKHQSSTSLASVWGIHQGPVNSHHKWPVTREMFPFDDVIMHCADWSVRRLYFDVPPHFTAPVTYNGLIWSSTNFAEPLELIIIAAAMLVEKLTRCLPRSAGC